jgi:hypothetical protein
MGRYGLAGRACRIAAAAFIGWAISRDVDWAMAACVRASVFPRIM